MRLKRPGLYPFFKSHAGVGARVRTQKPAVDSRAEECLRKFTTGGCQGIVGKFVGAILYGTIESVGRKERYEERAKENHGQRVATITEYLLAKPPANQDLSVLVLGDDSLMLGACGIDPSNSGVHAVTTMGANFGSIWTKTTGPQGVVAADLLTGQDTSASRPTKTAGKPAKHGFGGILNSRYWNLAFNLTVILKAAILGHDIVVSQDHEAYHQLRERGQYGLMKDSDAGIPLSLFLYENYEQKEVPTYFFLECLFLHKLGFELVKTTIKGVSQWHFKPPVDGLTSIEQRINSPEFLGNLTIFRDLYYHRLGVGEHSSEDLKKLLDEMGMAVLEGGKLVGRKPENSDSKGGTSTAHGLFSRFGGHWKSV